MTASRAATFAARAALAMAAALLPARAVAQEQRAPWSITALDSAAAAQALELGRAGQLPPALHLGAFMPGAERGLCAPHMRHPICDVGLVVHGPAHLLAAWAARPETHAQWSQARLEQMGLTGGYVWVTVAVMPSDTGGAALAGWADGPDGVLLQTLAGSALGGGTLVAPERFLKLPFLVPNRPGARPWLVFSAGFRAGDVPRENFDVVVSALGTRYRFEFASDGRRIMADSIR